MAPVYPAKHSATPAHPAIPFLLLLAIADDAVDRRTYNGVVEIDLSEIARG